MVKQAELVLHEYRSFITINVYKLLAGPTLISKHKRGHLANTIYGTISNYALMLNLVPPANDLKFVQDHSKQI